MRYRIAVVDEDTVYLTRFSKVFSEKYADKLEIISFSSMDSFAAADEGKKYDLVIIEEKTMEQDKLPEGLTFVYFVSASDIEKKDNINVICKYQRHDILLKKILEYCLDNENVHYTKKNVNGGVTSTIFVTGPSGGVGTTTVAISLAKYLAARNKKVLYFSTEKNPATEVYFETNVESTMSDVIYLVKSRKNNIFERVENMIQKDVSGVFFMPSCKKLFDLNEFSVKEMLPLLKDICQIGDYDTVIIDGQLEYNDNGFLASEFADDLLVVTTGSESGQKKLSRFVDAIKIWDTEKNSKIFRKVSIIFNQYSGNNAFMDNFGCAQIGMISKYGGVPEQQIVNKISELPNFEKYL